MQKEKLVRDNIIYIIKKTGNNPNFRIATALEYEKFLLLKAQEEALELTKAESYDDKVAEIADIIEVLRAIKKQFKIKNKDIVNKLKEKKKINGAFNKKYILTI